MRIVHQLSELRAFVNEQRGAGKRIGFVPTMGNLHDGHLSLIHTARDNADIVVCSIFVNPTQFGPNEDFDKYPRTLDADTAKLESAGCDIVFAPSIEEVYPDESQQWVNVIVNDITQYHCGSERPGHFDGVGLVVSKLFNMVQPDVAVFGKKDYQQLAVIKRLTTALNFPITIIGAETVREPSGLAMSSRNGFLTDSERQRAAALYQELQKMKTQIENGRRDYRQLRETSRRNLQEFNLHTEYYNISEQRTLKFADQDTKDFVILLACKLGNTRLIDNIDFSVT